MRNVGREVSNTDESPAEVSVMLSLQNGVTEKKRKTKVDKENKQGHQGMKDGEHKVFASLDGHVQGVAMGQHVHTLLAKDSDRTLLLAQPLFFLSCPLFDRIYLCVFL